MTPVPFSRDGIEHVLTQALADLRSAEYAVSTEGTLTGLRDALDWLEALHEVGHEPASHAIDEIEKEVLDILEGD